MKRIKIDNNQWLVAHKKYKKIVSKEWFDSNHWQANNAIDGESIGRATTYFFNHQEKRYVLREYRRGGLVGKLIEKKYFFKNIESTRAYQELVVLKQLRKLKLPVPKPVAALIKVDGYYYQAKIITRLIKNAEDLFFHLKKQSLSEQQWIAIGLLVKRFHAVGLYHSDLNIHNLMINHKSNFWLIDFDKCRFLKPYDKKLQSNIARLLRSLRKEKQNAQEKDEQFYWEEKDWAFFLQGYATKID